MGWRLVDRGSVDLLKPRLQPGLVVGLLLSSDNPLDFHAIVVSVSPVDILKVLEFVEIFNELMIKQLKTNIKSLFNCFSFFVRLYQ